MSALLAQALWFGPASTVGASVNVICTISDSGLQVPLPVEVTVKLTNPNAISPAVGVYVVINDVLFGLYVPAPPDQIPFEATVTVPAKFAVALLAHTIISAPASIVGAGVIFKVILSSIGVQFPVDVSVNVTAPADMSAGLGT